MAGKKEGAPISFRIEPELAAKLEAFVTAHRGWSKTETVCVALLAFLRQSEEDYERELLEYRRWLPKAADEDEPGASRSGTRKIKLP